MSIPTLRLNVGAEITEAGLKRPGMADLRWEWPVGLANLWPLTPAQVAPSPLAVEEAIQRVEDAIEPVVRHLQSDFELVVASGCAEVLRRQGVVRGALEGAVSMAEMEREYQWLAARALGAPSSLGSEFEDARGDALVLILRECMHHWGVEAVHLEGEGSRSAGQ